MNLDQVISELKIEVDEILEKFKIENISLKYKEYLLSSLSVKLTMLKMNERHKAEKEREEAEKREQEKLRKEGKKWVGKK